jgi:hypothetical protein
VSHENGKTTIELYYTRTQKIRPIFSLEKSPPYLIGAMPASPDGKWMLFPQIGLSIITSRRAKTHSIFG